MRVFIPDPPAPDILNAFRLELLPEIEVDLGPHLPELADYQVLVNGRPSKEQLHASHNLQRLVIPFAGVPASTRQLLMDFPHIKVYNLHHNAQATAELGLALLFAAAKFILPFDQDLRRHDWSRRYQPSPAVLLAGKTVLILGYGQIAQQIAKVLHVLGMRVLAVRRNLSQPAVVGGIQLFPVSSLAQLYPQAQLLVAALPLTQETQGMVGAEQLALLPKGAILVNIGRGETVQQQALFEALQCKHLAAAGLDVWYNYPQTPDQRSCTSPADYPFEQLENVVLSPHRAGLIQGIEVLRYSSLAKLLNQLFTGRAATNQVDLFQGY